MAIFFGLTVLNVSTFGCAINDVGFVRSEWFESDTGWMVTLKSFGVLVVTNGADRGITIGKSEKTYFFPKRCSDSTTFDVEQEAAGLASAARLHRVEGDDHPTLGDLGAPLAFATRSAGFMVHASSHRAGIVLGVESHAALRVRRDFDGIILVNYDSATSDANRLYVKEAVP